MSFKNETFVTAVTTVNGVKHKSNVTIDWTGMTEDDVQKLAQRSLIIRKQNADRVKELVPKDSYTVKATDYKIGARAPVEPVDIRSLLAKLPREEALALLSEVAGTAT